MERERIIEALKICDANYDGVVCKKCPIKDENYNGSWYDKDGDCYQHLMRETAELLSEQPTIQPEERTEKRTETHACDLVERQAVLDLARDLTFKNIEGLKHYRYRCIDPNHVRELKSVQLTEAIPVAWIEEEIAILKAKGNELAPMLMSAILSSELDNWKERLKNDNG